MLTRYFLNKDAVAEGERYALNLISHHPSLAVWLPLAYYTAQAEFENPIGANFEYNLVLNTVTKHTVFSKFIFDLVYHKEIRNLPVRSLSNGVGSANLSALLFAIYAAILYFRVDF